MKKLKLAILWHQHQPFYKDTLNNLYRMPWVLMHSYKDYYDMLWLPRRHHVKVTVNLVPVLIYQLEDYINNPRQDDVYVAIDMSAAHLDDGAKSRLRTYGFDSMNRARIHISERYSHLLNKHEAGTEFSTQEWLDLQVHLLLGWFGEVTYIENERMRELRQKDLLYTEEEKKEILKYGHELLKKVLEIHRDAFQKGEAEITTTPFFHPILPLLHSFDSARVSTPDCALPGVKSNMQDDVSEQIAAGKAYLEERMQKPIQGFWPSEGSVSPEVMPAFAENGIRWVATDAGILYNSLRISEMPADEKSMYRPYVYHTDKGPVNMFFRNTELADLIGFTYSKWQTDDAVANFISRMKGIYDLFQNDETEPVVSVILDGENAWEHYPNNGLDFLESLYRAIDHTDFIETVTFSEVLNQGPEPVAIPRLFSGSWIYSNLLTWIGHPEKNRGWEYLVDVRNIYAEKIDQVDQATREKAQFELFAAEGSDWFWWYGDTFYTPFADDFDALFRVHVSNVYTLLGEPVPASLQTPIRGERHSTGLKKTPENLLKFSLSGYRDGFFELLGAGEFDLTYDASTMHLATRRLKTLYFGEGETGGLYMCLEGNFEKPSGELLKVEVQLPAKEEPVILLYNLESQQLEQTHGLDSSVEITIAQGEVIEIYLPVQVETAQTDKVKARFEIIKAGQVQEKAPLYTMAELPAAAHSHAQWVV